MKRPKLGTRPRRFQGVTARRFNTAGFWAGLLVVLLLVGYVQVIEVSRPHVSGRQLPFSSFVNLTASGRIIHARILDVDSYVVGTYRQPGHRQPQQFNTPYLRDSNTRDRLVETLLASQVPFSIDQQFGKSLVGPLSILLPSLILVVVLIYFIYSYRRGTGLFGVRSGARKASSEQAVTGFDDVAAQDHAVTELRELAQFLSDPKRFTDIGARIPTGVLLYGPPGCGKTLLARALAGESGAAFFSISGSDFVELYVGVGASRVRELFKEAREHSPAIIFIDEIDAVGRRRRSGAALGQGSGEEQGQALNQLLSEMDGFASVQGTIVVGATNRPDDLDPALLRPGRFDRAISVDRPDEAGRTAILRIHAKGKPLAKDVDLHSVANRAIGLTGADLESVLNEAALLAARDNERQIAQKHLDGALTRILEAPERQRRLGVRDRSVGQRTIGAERVTFADVAGSQEALVELSEIRDFLSDPTRFADMGARFPRGFLLVGPPGCGKTLLARAVAGESNAAFLSVAATEFVEVFVGEGSGRVRDLFAQARAVAPAIIFIDEIDAIGARRGPSVDGHREREQTLNQILIELDGFRQRDGVIVMAATNRPEILDPALVRSGRFDRTITLGLPDRSDRREILQVHVGRKRLGPDVDLDAIAGITRGLSGADLANVLNEAALLSARGRNLEISMSDIESAVERATVGIGRGHVTTDEQRRIIAYHEAGHALVALTVPEGRLPHAISIIPSPRSLGRAWLIDRDGSDRVMHSRSGLIDEMAILLGGRGAEKLIFGSAGTGAVGDLAWVGRIAHSMVREMGMSEAVGPIGYPQDQEDGQAVTTYSEETARIIDAEARHLVDEAETRADEVLRTSREALDRVATALIESETLSAREIELLVSETAQAPV
jgi:cell division protease FtsH